MEETRTSAPSRSASSPTETRVQASPEVGLYEGMLLIRLFEERLLDEYSRGTLVGTTHTYIGQEANAVGIFSVTHPDDIVFSNHRCHGHMLAYGGDPRRLAAELMGKKTGFCGGRGGSQHLCWHNFHSNGVLGGTVPNATGMALAERAKQSGQVVLVFMGDGTLGEGVVYESLNIASLWRLPIIFVVENNHYAQSTPIHLALAGSIPGRFQAFGIEPAEVDSTDVLAVRDLAAPVVAAVRDGQGPGALVIHTYRFSPHSKGDDSRDPAEITERRLRDPLLVHGNRLTEEDRQEAHERCTGMVNDAFALAYDDPFPSPSDLVAMLETLP